MKLSQKRSCAGCKAYPYDSWKRNCQLGISIEPTTKYEGMILNFKPMGLCYKPKTIKQMFTATELTRKR